MLLLEKVLMSLWIFAKLYSRSGFILKLIWLLHLSRVELCSIFKSISPFVQMTVIHLR